MVKFLFEKNYLSGNLRKSGNLERRTKSGQISNPGSWSKSGQLGQLRNLFLKDPREIERQVFCFFLEKIPRRENFFVGLFSHQLGWTLRIYLYVTSQMQTNAPSFGPMGFISAQQWSGNSGTANLITYDKALRSLI